MPICCLRVTESTLTANYVMLKRNPESNSVYWPHSWKVSSEPSWQSLSVSQVAECGIHRPERHVNSCAEHVTFPAIKVMSHEGHVTVRSCHTKVMSHEDHDTGRLGQGVLIHLFHMNNTIMNGYSCTLATRLDSSVKIFPRPLNVHTTKSIAIFTDFCYFEIKPEMRDVLAKMRECRK